MGKHLSKHFENIKKFHVYSITEYTYVPVPGWEWDDWSESYYWGTVYETKEVKRIRVTAEPIWWLRERGRTMYTSGGGFSDEPFAYAEERITKVW